MNTDQNSKIGDEKSLNNECGLCFDTEGYLESCLFRLVFPIHTLKHTYIYIYLYLFFKVNLQFNIFTNVKSCVVIYELTLNA